MPSRCFRGRSALLVNCSFQSIGLKECLAAVAAAFAMVSCDKEEIGKDIFGGIMIDGHEVIDMGDGLLWATCNIGAESEPDYGSYFSWGETSEKASYFPSKYKFGTVDLNTSDDDGMEKYNTQDNLTRLLPDDDAATTLWGESWRTPTSAEMKSLLNPELYGVKWTSKVGKDGSEINGMEITNKHNKNSIFLPAAGRNYDRQPLDEFCMMQQLRHCGFTIRAVARPIQ